jgi:hypothetical protein
MKQELIKYTCDQCGHTITINTGNYAGTRLDSHWIRLYIKDKLSDVQKTKHHFCTKGCTINFLRGT